MEPVQKRTVIGPLRPLNSEARLRPNLQTQIVSREYIVFPHLLPGLGVVWRGDGALGDGEPRQVRLLPGPVGRAAAGNLSFVVQFGGRLASQCRGQ